MESGETSLPAYLPTYLYTNCLVHGGSTATPFPNLANQHCICLNAENGVECRPGLPRMPNVPVFNWPSGRPGPLLPPFLSPGMRRWREPSKLGM